MLKNKATKIIAPVIIVIISILYFSFLGWTANSFPLPVWGKILAFIIYAAIVGTCIYVLIQRIREIRSGEEDDLSKY